jgi:hypothetical protein
MGPHTPYKIADFLLCNAGLMQQEVMYGGEGPGMMMAAPMGSGGRLYGAAAAGPGAVQAGAARAAGWVPLAWDGGAGPSGSSELAPKRPGAAAVGVASSGAMGGGNLVQVMDPSGQVYYINNSAA